jgi:hypothetical protein
MSALNYSKLLVSLLLLVQRVLVLLLVVGGIGTVMVFFEAVKTTSYSSEERERASICQLPENVLYYYFWISNAYRLGETDWGERVARFWLETSYFQVPEDQALFRGSKLDHSLRKENESLKQAARVNFHLSESLPFTDEDVLLEINITKKRCADSIRRADFYERFDDFLRLFGLASLLGLATAALCGLTNKISNARERLGRRNADGAVGRNPEVYKQLQDLAVSRGFVLEGSGMGWAGEERKEVDVGDRRLNKRAITSLDTLAAKPTMSIPSACSGWSETVAAYRFLDNDAVTWESILAPHWSCSQTRIACHKVVLMLQDTTELDFNGQSIDGLGPLSHEAQRGLYVHPTYAVSTDREPLGVLDAWMWAREPKDADGQRPRIKESTRWVAGYERVAELAADLPDTRLVYVADLESDMIELMARADELDTPADWLLRAQHDRALPDGQKLWQTVTSGEELGGISFTLPARHGQKARVVRQQLWARVVDLPHGKKQIIRATCVVAKEIDPPAGSTPVEWRLLTNRSAETLAEVAELIDWYRARWEIEILFHILKNGCRIESLQLRTIDGLQRAIALYLIVSWRIAMLIRFRHTCPDLPADLFFDQDEWHAAYLLNKKKPPADPPTLNQVLRLVAMLGGFMAHKGDGEPGVKTIWIGLQRVMGCVAGLQFIREADSG